MKRLLIILVLVLLMIPAVASASVNKFGFNDLTFPDGTLGELKAGSKITNKGDFTSCSYFSDDYQDYLGYFQSSEFASEDAGEVLAFCLANYGNRELP